MVELQYERRVERPAVIDWCRVESTGGGEAFLGSKLAGHVGPAITILVVRIGERIERRHPKSVAVASLVLLIRRDNTLDCRKAAREILEAWAREANGTHDGAMLPELHARVVGPNVDTDDLRRVVV